MDSATDPDPPPAARKRAPPRLHMGEAEWSAAMEDFRAGMTMAEVKRKWDIGRDAVAAQCLKRAVTRRDNPTPRVRGTPFVPVEVGAGAVEPGPALDVPEGEDAGAWADALGAHSRALLARGRLAEAAAYDRLGRAYMAGARARRELEAQPGEFGGPLGGAAGEVRPAPPVLRAAQTPPAGDWRSWLFLGGRGAGKTLAGAAWLAGRARACGRLALVGPSLLDVREVMIEGPSGLRGLASAFGPEGARPRYEPSRRRLVWPNGAVAHVFSAEDPDGLRGPQFEAAWADEVCAWAYPHATLSNLRLGLRLGTEPRLMLTTTPRPCAVLAELLAEAGMSVTRGSARDNAAHLAAGFLENLCALYGGTRLERQEIEGEVLEAPEGAVFRREDVEGARALWADGAPERFDRMVVAVDPPAGLDGAACGLVVAGRSGRRVWVLEDLTLAGASPLGWASRVCAAAGAAARRGPVRVVAEANQGGEMVRSVLLTAGLEAPLRLVHATAGKAARAEPVALLYAQARVAHAPGLEALEDQLLLLGARGAARRAGCSPRGASPDRADALVWALTALLLDPEPERVQPRVRVV